MGADMAEGNLQTLKITGPHLSLIPPHSSLKNHSSILCHSISDTLRVDLSLHCPQITFEHVQNLFVDSVKSNSPLDKR